MSNGLQTALVTGGNCGIGSRPSSAIGARSPGSGSHREQPAALAVEPLFKLIGLAKGIAKVPLRSLNPIANSSVHAFDLSPEEWRTLELENRAKRHLRMPCCSSQVTLKKSRLGTQFFAHKAVGDCSTAPETETHLRLKQMAVAAARAAGWDAETEVAGTTPSGEQWKADVLARKGEIKVAIEIQWSAQTKEETLRRQKRYAQSDVRCLWLLRQSDFPVDHALPAARISGNLKEGFIALVPSGSRELQSVPMQDFLTAAFNKRLRFGVPLGASANVSVRAGHMFCWLCGAETQIITGVDVEFGPHECAFSVPDLDAYPDLFDVVRSRLPNDLRIGAIKRRFSKAQERLYLSNGCAHCDALIGEFSEHEAWEDQKEMCAFPIRITEQWRQAIEGNVAFERGWGVYPAEPSYFSNSRGSWYAIY
jgi:competence protein CoiA